MAGARDDEGSYSPKHRILGAIIVVSLAVIFLPMILSDGNAPPRRESPVSKVSEAPPPDTKVFRMPAASLEPAPAPPASSVGASKPEATSPAQQNLTVKPAPGVSASARPRTHDQKAPSKVVTTQSREQAVTEGANTDTAGKTEGWILQVGTFSSDENAKRLRDRLQKEGFLVNLQNVELKGRKVVRVRVGPFRQKHVAMEARSKIEKEVGLEGVLLAYP